MPPLFLRLLLALTLLPTFAQAAPPTRPTVGAIRWDGWTSEGPVTRAVTKSLSPAEWRSRWPFFAKTRPDGTLEHLHGDTPEVMTAEIAAAKTAHLDYWAFLAYDEADPMTRGLQLYLANPRRSDINFCVISETARWQRSNAPALAERFARLMAEPGYQRVTADGRPLFYFLHHNTDTVTQVWGGHAAFREAVELLKSAAIARGLPTPYIAVMTYDVNEAQALLDGAGLDAISAYAFQRGDKNASYSKLTSDLEALWEIQHSRAPVIPLAMAGWDRRPRVQNPVPWEHFGGTMDQYYETATPDQLAAHIATAVKWTQTYATNCPAQSVIIYAWNEFDEGGWLCPTLEAGNARVHALGRVLKPYE